MTEQAEGERVYPQSGWLLLAVCLGQVALIALPFLKSEVAPFVVVIVLLSTVALLSSVTFAVLYLCLISAVVPSKVFEDYLGLPLGFRFYEGLFVLSVCLVVVSWLQERRLSWPRTRLDRPVMCFLALTVVSMGVGVYYGQSTFQMLWDIRYIFYYALFFAVAGFFDHRRSGAFLTTVVLASVVVGVEYLFEFLGMVNLSIAGSFYRVARTEGLMLLVGTLVIAAGLVYDSSPFRRKMGALALIPIGLALVLTVGRAMWIALIVGICCLGYLVVRDRQSSRERRRRILSLLMVPVLMIGIGYAFQRMTGTGVKEVAFGRLARAANYREDLSFVGRMVLYRLAAETFLQHPLLGSGHGTTISSLVAPPDGTPPFVFTTGAVDNVYLTVMMRMGIVGLAAFLWVFVRGGRTAHRLFFECQTSAVRLFCAAFLAVYAAMLAYGMADATMVGNRLIFLHATFLGILGRLDAEEKADETPA